MIVNSGHIQFVVLTTSGMAHVYHTQEFHHEEIPATNFSGMGLTMCLCHSEELWEI